MFLQCTSKTISNPLINWVLSQEYSLANCHTTQQSLKRHAQSRKHSKSKEDTENLRKQIPSTLQRCMELSQEKGASVCTTHWQLWFCSPYKSAFRDALSLSCRYDWPFNNQPSHCNYGHSLPSILAWGIGSRIVARDGSKCCVYIYMYVSHTLCDVIAENLWTPENLSPDFDRCPKEVLVVLKVPWVYTESDDVERP